MKRIVLDKSFLQGKKSTDMAKLCEQADVLMTETHFYELITTDSESRQKCFKNIPNRHNPFKIVQLANMLNFEVEQKCPYGELSNYIIDVPYTFNPMMRDGSYKFTGEVEKDRKQWQESVKERTKVFIRHCQTIDQYFPELNGIPTKDLPKAIDKARRKVAQNHNFVSKICSSIFIFSNGTEQIKFDANWALFRLIQCEMLWALRFVGKGQDSFPKYTKMEHSMLDVDYVVM